MKLPALSIFAGGGGLDVGVDSAGFTTRCAIELDPHCASTLTLNAPRKAVWRVDVQAINAIRMMAALDLKPGELALLHGGPPCQPYSQMGLQGGLNDPRGGFVFEMVRFAAAFRPSAVMIVQVPKFLVTSATRNATVVEVLADEFAAIGYDLCPALLDAIDFGVPQRRRRAFVVCIPKGQAYAFPTLPALKPQPRTVGEAINDLPAAVRATEEPAIPNHVDVTPDRDRYRISFVPVGQWLSKAPDVPPSVRQKLTPKDPTKFRRLDRSQPSLTLRCGEAMYHPCRGPLHHAARSRTHSWLPRQARVRRADSSQDRESTESRPASAGGKRCAAAPGAGRGQQRENCIGPVVHELFGRTLSKGDRQGETLRATCPHMDGKLCNGGGNRDMARWPTGEQPLAPFFHASVGKAGDISCGVCSVKTDRGAWAICPHRLLSFIGSPSVREGALFWRVVALGGFVSGDVVRVWSEITLSSRREGINCRLDYILRSAQRPPIVVDIMTASTSGGNQLEHRHRLDRQ